MHTRCLLVAALCGAQHAHAQPLLERADQRADLMHHTRILPIPGPAWATFGDKNDPGGVASMNLLSAWNSTGDLLWSTGFADMVFVAGDVAAGPDSSILACGPWNGCDVLGTHSIITRINGDGSTAWSAPVAVDGLQHIATHADSLLAFATANMVHLTDLNGDSLTQWSTPDAPVEALCWTSNDHLLLAANSALHLTSASGIPLGITPIGGVVRQLAARPDGHIWVLRADEVLSVSADLQSITAFDLSAYTTDARRLATDGNDAWVLTPTEVVRVEASLGPIGSFPLNPLPGHQVADLAFGNGRLTTAGHADLFTTTAAVLRDYDSTGLTAVHDADVSIAIAAVDSTWLVPLGPPNIHSLRTALTLTLTNHGNSVVHELLLSHQLGQPWICGLAGTMLPLTQLNLQPGQSVDVPFTLTTGFPQSFPPGSTATANVCIVAASPQHRVDRTPADNQACTTISIVGVGIAQEVGLATFTVFPNPFSDELNLAVDPGSGPIDIRLCDPVGRVVHTERVDPGSARTHRLKLPALLPGAYVLSVHRRSGARSMQVLRSAVR
ncbi:MAG TPA: hypothetical protein PLH93_06940 [Flavobacteriales bacterium]|nr:T9SS type A sorting domain-containing protein [Flavobacteriales bacterium]HQW86902.1 hypothetical protein [Flavobacteriales bacterium]